jgi:hypothetical protein
MIYPCPCERQRFDGIPRNPAWCLLESGRGTTRAIARPEAVRASGPSAPGDRGDSSGAEERVAVHAVGLQVAAEGVPRTPTRSFRRS